MSSPARPRPVMSESTSSQPSGVSAEEGDESAAPVVRARSPSRASARGRGKGKRRGKARRTGRSAPTSAPSGAPVGRAPGAMAGGVDRAAGRAPDIRYCEVTLASETFAVISMPTYDATVAQALTRGERDIVVRILLGQSNQEIANARGSQLSTVSNQVYSIFDKLGVESRTQLAERAVPRASDC